MLGQNNHLKNSEETPILRLPAIRSNYILSHHSLFPYNRSHLQIIQCILVPEFLPFIFIEELLHNIFKTIFKFIAIRVKYCSILLTS